MILRIAFGLARNPAPEHRWRRVVAPISAAVFMLLVFAGSSVVVMLQREESRTVQRAAILASEPSPTDLKIVALDDMWGGEQFPVVWIEVAGDGTPVLPPGMARLPKPGQAVVSPGLNRLASRHPDLASRYPNPVVLGAQGIRNEDELFAYVRFPEGRSVPGDLAGDISNDTRAVRVNAFGSSSGPAYGLDAISLPLSIGSVVVGVFGFLGLPGMIVLIVGLSAASGLRDRRFEVMRWIGVPGRRLAALAVLETLILAVPGLVAAVVLWGVVSPRLGWVPLADHDAVYGDLALPWWLLAAESGASIALIGLVSVVATTATSGRRRRGATNPRPVARRAELTPLRAAPLGLALALFVLGSLIGGPMGGTLNLIGILATLVGVPLVFPGVLRAAGAALGRLESVPMQVAGRNLEWDPRRTARPFLGVAAIVVIALSASGYLAFLNHVEAWPLPTGETSAVFVEWLDPHPEDHDRLADAMGAGLVVPLREGEHTHAEHRHTHGDTMFVGAACSRIAPYFSGATCDPDAPFELPAATEQRLAEALAPAAHGPGTEIRLAPESEVADGASALVLGNASPTSLESRVRGAATRTLLAPYVYGGYSGGIQQSPLVAWIHAGVIAAVISLALGCFLSLVDRLLSTRKHRNHLLNLGASPHRIASLEAWRFIVPFGAVFFVSFVSGLAICMLMVGGPDGISMPWRGIGITLGTAVVIGLVGTVSVAFFSARSIRENPE